MLHHKQIFAWVVRGQGPHLSSKRTKRKMTKKHKLSWSNSLRARKYKCRKKPSNHLTVMGKQLCANFFFYSPRPDHNFLFLFFFMPARWSLSCLCVSGFSINNLFTKPWLIVGRWWIFPCVENSTLAQQLVSEETLSTGPGLQADWSSLEDRLQWLVTRSTWATSPTF